jgi:hypothetical protein
MSILDLYCAVDAFWQRFEPLWERELLASGQRRRRRATRLHPAGSPTVALWVWRVASALDGRATPLFVNNTV